MKDFWFFILIGVCTSILFSSGQVENPDTHLRLAQAKVLTENFEFGLPNDTGEDFHGNIAINSNGKRHMVYNPGQTLLFCPIYKLCDLNVKSNPYYTSTFVVSFINFFIHAVSGFFFFSILLILSKNRKKSLLISLIFLFTSYSFSFAQSTYEHHYEMLFVLISFYLLLSSNGKKWILFAGLAISIGLIFRTTTILVVPGLLFLLKSRKDMVLFLVACMPGLALVLLYNYIRFNTPLETGYGLAWSLAHGKEFVFWSVLEVPRAFFGFLFSPGKGLIFFSTTIFLSIFGFKKFFKVHKRVAISIIITAFLYILLYSANFAWHGSIWSFGPRYVLPILPLLYLFLIEVKLSNWFKILCVFGLISQIIFMSVNYKRNVLEQYITYGEIADDSYIFSANNIPQICQTQQFIEIIPKNINRELKNYQPNSAWKKEIRTGSNLDVLEHSIEKNSINFWWVRILHWQKPIWVLIVSFIFVILTSYSLFFIIKSKLKEVED